MARYRGTSGATFAPPDRALCCAILAMRCVSGSLIVSASYNAVQRLLYTAVILCICVQVLTGLAVHLLLVAIYPRTLVSMVASTKAEEEQ